ncbi:hypothetical protein OAN35_00130 [Flavobacteriaceae bacterium]|nr:hypothetical protein [Flavobacteriaceae bacterium]
MKPKKNALMLLAILIALPLMGQKIEPLKVKQIMQKEADWEIENLKRIELKVPVSIVEDGKLNLKIRLKGQKNWREED